MKLKKSNERRFWAFTVPMPMRRAWVVGGDPRDGHYVTTRKSPPITVKPVPRFKRAHLQ